MIPALNKFSLQDAYWVTASGKIYSSRRNAFVHQNDPAYRAFVAANGGVAQWPADSAGKQTSASLAQVLAYYGITLTPPAP